jgi:hypothetical protein
MLPQLRSSGKPDGRAHQRGLLDILIYQDFNPVLPQEIPLAYPELTLLKIKKLTREGV